MLYEIEKVRENFETNSSSSHVLVINDKKDDKEVIKSFKNNFKRICENNNYDIIDIHDELCKSLGSDNNFGWNGDPVNYIGDRTLYLLSSIISSLYSNNYMDNDVYEIIPREKWQIDDIKKVKKAKWLLEDYFDIPELKLTRRDYGLTAFVEQECMIDHESSFLPIDGIIEFGAEKYFEKSTIYIDNDNDNLVNTDDFVAAYLLREYHHLFYKEGGKYYSKVPRFKKFDGYTDEDFNVLKDKVLN